MMSKQSKSAASPADFRECIFYLDITTHDLLNFNQAVLGYLELILGEKSVRDETQHYLTSAIEQVKNSSQLIEEIRKIIHLGILEDSSLEDISIDEIINESIDEISLHFPDREIEVNFRDKGSKAVIRGTDILKDVVVNLLTNSIKFDESKKIVIDMSLSHPEKLENMIDLVIEDRGIGIPDSLKKMLLGDALTNGRTRRARGIGLLLVNAAVSRLGGSLILDDRVSGDHTQGAKISVRLPEVQNQ